MSSPDRPQWQEQAQRYLLPKWGTTIPLDLHERDLPLYSKNGRPLSERLTQRNLAEVASDFIDSPYDDMRKDGVQNDSAYKSVMQDFKEGLGVISYVRSKLHPYDRRPTFAVMDSVINAVSILPYFLVMRADGTPLKNGEIPDDIAAAAKIARGFDIPFDIQRALLINTRYTGKKVPPSSFWQSAEGVVNHVFQNDLLVGEETIIDANGKRKKISCPASRPNIARAAEVIWEEPTEYMEAAGERLSDLGISDSDFARLQKMGLAHAVLDVEEAIFLDAQQSRSDTSSKRREERLKTIFYRTQATALANYNAALGRQ